MKPFASVLESRAGPKTGGPPIFVVGSARSGTTLLYHMLLSSGVFARFLASRRFLICWFPGSAT